MIQVLQCRPKSQKTKMDLALDKNMDFLVEDGEFVEQINGETTLVTALFTDARVGGERGYWLDINDSSLWVYEQSKLSDEARSKINIAVNQSVNQLVNDGLYEDINTEVYILGDRMNINIRCYNDSQEVVNKSFTL